MFLIYINDIVNASTKFKYTIYADDTNLVLNDDDLDNLHENLHTELNAVHNWIRNNKLNLNITKTNYIIFQNRSIMINLPPVLLEGRTLERVQYTKFLGVLVDENINWKSQINSVVTKLSRMCGILYRIRHNLTMEALISIYYTLCYPHLTYCVSIWACTWPSFLHKMQIAQNKIFRCMFYMKKFDSTRTVICEQKFLNFNNIHRHFLLSFIFKCLTQQQGSQHFHIISTSHNTRRNNVNLFSPQFRTVLFRNSILCHGPLVWNSLPLEIKKTVNSGSYSHFKKSLKAHLLTHDSNQM